MAEQIMNAVEKRFKIYQRFNNKVEEFIGPYPNFNTLEEGLEYIRIVLSPGIYSVFSIADMEDPANKPK